MAIWFFNEVVWFVLAAMLEDILLPSNMAAKTTFCLYLVKLLIVTLRCAVKVTTSSFNIFLKFKCKICVQKEVIHNFKNQILATWLLFSLKHDHLVQMAYFSQQYQFASRWSWILDSMPWIPDSRLLDSEFCQWYLDSRLDSRFQSFELYFGFQSPISQFQNGPLEPG